MKSILCIDDEPSAMLSRRLLLESEGYNVTTAETGAEGISLFKQSRFDVVVLDYWMPEMNGVEVARQLKQIDASIPIIVLSAFAELPGEAVGLADRWIMKGHSAQQLLEIVNRAMAGSA